MDLAEWQVKMDEAMPHGPDEPCTCDGCHNGETGCTGRTPGCTCDIDWSAAAELHRDRPGRY